MLTDPLFYLLAVPAVILIGLSKGGFGGALALLGVPLVALAIPPVQAAAIFLPILLIMDAAGLYVWRGTYHKPTLKIMLPGALAGIFIGWLLAAHITDAHIRLIVGFIALGFSLRWWLGGREAKTASPQRPWTGRFWAVVAGFTSFVSHAGGPPYQIYTLPLKLHPTVYAGTGVIFFATVNAVKVVPYFALGQFTIGNLLTSALLMPLAPLATFAGAWLVKRVSQDLFYRISYAALIPVGLKLIWDGFTG